jgi:cephalosporin hydroxylase
MKSKVEYTVSELNEFRKLVTQGESINQMDRIHNRLDMPKFIERVGKDKCDAMWEVVKDE